MVPDFGSTAHMVQGQTLDGAFADARECCTAPTGESHIASYIAFSRVKELLKIRILQPFSTFLFRQGAPNGPSILMRKLRREVSAEQAVGEALQHLDEKAECKKSSGRRDIMKQQFICTSCYFL